MIIETAIVNELLANAGVSALVQARIYNVTKPQSVAQPFIEVTKISAVPNYTHGGQTGPTASRFQVSCFDNHYEHSRAVATAVKAALSGFTGTMGGTGGVTIQGCFLDGDADGDVDENAGLYPVYLDFIIHHEE